MASNGFTVGGQRYTYTRGEVDDNDDGPMYIQGRCKDEGKSAQGVIIYCTTASFIVGVHDPSFSDGASFGKVNTQIGKVADYLIDAGF